MTPELYNAIMRNQGFIWFIFILSPTRSAQSDVGDNARPISTKAPAMAVLTSVGAASEMTLRSQVCANRSSQ